MEQQDRAYRGLENIMKMGSGQQGEAITGLTQIADLSGAYARESAQKGFNKATGRKELAGSVVGMGAGAALDNNYGLTGMSTWRS